LVEYRYEKQQRCADKLSAHRFVPCLCASY
jgi:hypothetical protein